MSTTIAPGAAAGPGAAPARDQAAATSAPRAGRRRGSVLRPGNHAIVVFGATGDLAHRKLLPGLFHLAIPSAAFMPAVAMLGDAGLAGGSRVIIEKPPPAGRRRPRAAARREGHLRRARSRCLAERARRARPPRAPRGRRAQRPASPAGPEPAGPARAANRAAGRRRADQPGDRPAALPIGPHRPQPSVPDLPQARHHFTR
jgi:hypothetical protein